MFHYVYSTLFPKYFRRVDDFGMRNKLAFEVAHVGYQTQKKKNIVAFPFTTMTATATATTNC